MDLSTEHKVLDLKNRIEASIMIWKRKMNHKDGKSTWGSAISVEKRELFEERAETILLLLKQKFPGIPQSSLDISKIECNNVRYFLRPILCGMFTVLVCCKKERNISTYRNLGATVKLSQVRAVNCLHCIPLGCNTSPGPA